MGGVCGRKGEKMRKYLKVKTEELHLDKISCGWCGKKLKDNNIFYEGTTFEVRFGYGSEFDLTEFEFEICDKCFVKFLKPKSSRTIESGIIQRRKKSVEGEKK